MTIDVLTLFPEMFSALNTSILKRAQDNGKILIRITDIRDFAQNKHFQCDDIPFGGGAGMVMMCQPIFDAIDSVKTDNSVIFAMSPRGTVFDQQKATEMSKMEHIVILCGHYEGIDQRVYDYFNIQELSVGDYVLTGGEIPAMAVVDAVARLVPGVIKSESLESESFSNNLLEYNQYTRPAEYKGMKVPDVLLNGHHAKINEYRLRQSIEITKRNRPDLYEKYIKESK